jgi:alpha-beta hydrolase superfamily lysophospholipase
VTLQTDDKGRFTSLLYQEGDRPPVRALRREVLREDVSFRNGDMTLTGTVTLPTTKGPHPAIVLIHGSGPEDRNFLGPWIDFFARQGLAVLSYDKRGTGTSAGDWKQSGIDDLAGDAQAAFRYLAGRTGVDPKRIGLFGISQGGWIAPLVASRHPEVAFIVLHAGAGVPVVRQGELLLEHELRAYGLPEEQIAEALAHQRLDDEFTRNGQGWEKLQESYRKASEAKADWLISEPQPADSWFRTMYRKMMDFDPVPFWRQVKCPVLAFFGEMDHNVPPRPNVEILERTFASAGHENHSIVVLPQANHLFLQAETGVMTEYPRLKGFVPGYFEQLGSWIQRVAYRGSKLP